MFVGETLALAYHHKINQVAHVFALVKSSIGVRQIVYRIFQK